MLAVGTTTGRLGCIGLTLPRNRRDGAAGTTILNHHRIYRINTTDDYGPDGAAGAWAPPPLLQGPHNSFGTTAGRMEQRANDTGLIPDVHGGDFE